MLNTSCSALFHTCTACRVLESLLATELRQFKYTRHPCGHTLPKLEDPHDASCKLCVPVMAALRCYHDQVTQVCIEDPLQQPPLRMPKPCRPITPNTLGETEEIAHIHAQDQTRSEGIMDRDGVSSAERSSIETLALRRNRTSRSLPKLTLGIRQVLMELYTS